MEKSLSLNGIKLHTLSNVKVPKALNSCLIFFVDALYTQIHRYETLKHYLIFKVAFHDLY